MVKQTLTNFVYIRYCFELQTVGIFGVIAIGVAFLAQIFGGHVLQVSCKSFILRKLPCPGLVDSIEVQY